MFISKYSCRAGLREGDGKLTVGELEDRRFSAKSFYESLNHPHLSLTLKRVVFFKIL